jgi:hypothetical protein
MLNVNPIAAPTVLLAGGSFCLGAYLQPRLQVRWQRLALWTGAVLAAIPGTLFVLYYAHLFDHFAWFYELRSATGSELAVAGLGVLAGLIHAWSAPERIGEKAAAPLILAVLALIPFVKPLLEPLDLAALQDRCDGEVCLQSSPSTCGPASAAVLLRTMGQNASERQLAAEAFSYRGGTEVWYLARALRRRGVPARFIMQNPQSDSLPAPAIAGVKLPGGAGHFVAILENRSQQIVLMDPLKGKLVIDPAELHRRYHFTGFFLSTGALQ